MVPSQRRLNIFLELANHKLLHTQALADLYHVDPHTIHRDIASLRQLLSDRHEPQIIEYDRQQKGYHMHSDQNGLNQESVLLLIKVLLASRALNKSELTATISGLLNLIPATDKTQVQPLIQNEQFHYVPVHHQQNLLDRLWQLSRDIERKLTLDIEYQRRHTEIVQRTILPEAIIFSEYYFYLIGYSPEHDINLLYRLDRITAMKPSKTKIIRQHQDRVEPGLIRQRTPFMYQGQPLHIKFRFWGVVEAALDRFPTAKIVQYYNADGTTYQVKATPGHYHQPERNGSVVIEADVDGEYGAMMWLLSQGQTVEVLAPASLREHIISALQGASERYR